MMIIIINSRPNVAKSMYVMLLFLTVVADESSHSVQILAWLAIWLSWFSEYDSFHLFLLAVFSDESHEVRRGDSHQPTCNYLQWVSDCQSGTFLSVVYRKYSHILFVIENPSVSIL